MNKKSYLARVRLPRTPADWLEAMMNFIFFLCGMLAVGCVVLITVYMVLSGVPAIHKIGLFRFLFGTEWASTAADPKFGILPFILSSVYGTLGATLIGVPVGLLTAVFLSKAAGPKVRTVVVTAIELLSGIPSVVFGLLGMQVLVPAVAKTFGKASGACLLSAIVVLFGLCEACAGKQAHHKIHPEAAHAHTNQIKHNRNVLFLCHPRSNTHRLKAFLRRSAYIQIQPIADTRDLIHLLRCHSHNRPSPTCQLNIGHIIDSNHICDVVNQRTA